METIIYGVCGEGKGHSTRSETAIQKLIEEGFDVQIFASGNAHTYLSNNFKNCHKIKHFKTIIKNDSKHNLLSILSCIENLPKELVPSLRKIISVCYDKNTKLIISDFEALTSLVANYLGIPSISASNINIIEKTKLNIKEKNMNFPKLLSLFVNRIVNKSAKLYIIPTFFKPNKTSKKVILCDPPIRREIQNKKININNHVLVYYSRFSEELETQLLKINQKFYYYNNNKEGTNKNITYKKITKKDFIKDLLSCKAIISSSGFSLISEAIYLKKPILVIPVKRHYEQLINAHYIKEQKYGEFIKDFNSTEIQDFLLKLPLYNHYLKQNILNPSEFEEIIVEKAKEFLDKKLTWKYKLNKFMSKTPKVPALLKTIKFRKPFK